MAVMPFCNTCKGTAIHAADCPQLAVSPWRPYLAECRWCGSLDTPGKAHVCRQTGHVEPAGHWEKHLHMDAPKDTPAVAGEQVILPAHYTQYKIEPIYFIRENNLPFWMGNVIKYVTRAEMKDGIQDLKKARRYLDMEIARQEGRTDYAATHRDTANG